MELKFELETVCIVGLFDLFGRPRVTRSKTTGSGGSESSAGLEDEIVELIEFESLFAIRTFSETVIPSRVVLLCCSPSLFFTLGGFGGLTKRPGLPRLACVPLGPRFIGSGGGAV